VLEAFERGYPGRFSPPEKYRGDWSILLDGERYLWSEGRLLPEALADEAKDWSPHPFYTYPEELPPVRRLDSYERDRLIALAALRDREPPERCPDFFDRLWGSPDEKSAWNRMKTIRFLGREILVNRSLLEEIAEIEAEVLELSSGDRGVRVWIDGIGETGSWLWREIAGTKSRSYHAYGAAIDLVPSRSGSKAWYWLSARDSGLPWYELPYDKRSSVPASVVSAFERHGFVWGGKWRFWDMVHFEYRPEILILNGQRPFVQVAPSR
jgi:hypothetical protein